MPVFSFFLFGAIKWHQVARKHDFLRILEVLQYTYSTSCFMLHGHDLFRAVSWKWEPFEGTHTCHTQAHRTVALAKLISTKRHPAANCHILAAFGNPWTEATIAICRTLPMKQSWTRSSAPFSMAYQRHLRLCMVFTFPFLTKKWSKLACSLKNFMQTIVVR